MTLVKNIKKNLLYGAVGKLMIALTPVLMTPVLINSWGELMYGEWLTVSAVAYLIAFSPDLGLAAFASNQIAMNYGAKNYKIIPSIIKTCIFIIVSLIALQGILVATVLLAFGGLWLDLKVLNNTEVVLCIFLIWISIASNSLNNLYSGIYRAKQKNPRMALILAANHFVMILGLLLVVLWNGKVLALAIGYAVSSILALIIIQIDSRKLDPSMFEGGTINALEYIKDNWSRSAGHGLMPLFHAMNNSLPIIIISKIAGAADVTYFQTIRIMLNSMKSIVGLVTNAFLAEMPRLYGAADSINLKRINRYTFDLCLFASLMLYMSHIVAGETIYRLWLGETVKYENIIANMLMLSLIPFALGQLSMMKLIATNNVQKVILYLIISSIFLNICGVALMVSYGLMGMVWMLLILECLIFLVFKWKADGN